MRPRLLTTALGVLRHLALAATCAALILVPDHVYQLQYSGYQTRFNTATFAILTAAFSLGLSGSAAAFIALASVVVFLQFAELMHFSYFGSLISPHAVILLFSETAEIVETLRTVLGHMALPFVIAGVELLLLVVLFRTTRRWHMTFPFAWVPVIGLFAVLPLKAHGPQVTAQQYYPNPREYAVANSLFAVSYFLGHVLPQSLSGRLTPVRCQPYRSERTNDPLADNIVIVMGESLSASHMSLFDYARDTTPRLRALARNGELFATIAYTAGISTKVTLPMFYNIQREPGNFAHMFRMESNLFRLAKQQGFTTHYISAQTAKLATYVGEHFIDEFLTREAMVQAVTARKDRVLIDRLQRIDMTRRNFIVLHQRNSHSPYDQQYPPEFARYPTRDLDFAGYMVNSYDNSILFTDDLVAEIIAYLKRHSPNRTLLLFTADHAELMGEHGQFGHSILEIETSRVPFVAYGQNLDRGTLRLLSSLSRPTHYEISKQIAAILGYRIENPNETSGLYYVAGQDIGGQSGYLAIDKRMSPPRITTVIDATSPKSICPAAR